MLKLSGLFLFAVLISGVLSSSFAFAQIGPIAEDDFYSIDEDTLLSVNSIGVLTNDTNIDNGFFVILQTNTGFGTLALNLDGSFTYLPSLNFNSIDSFTYVVTNGTLSSNNATVTLSVNPINDKPVAQNNTATTSENNSIIIPVLNNDSDVDGDLLTVISVTQGINGTITTNGTIVTYTPQLNFHGEDSFTYRISDGINISNLAIVTVTVTLVDNENNNSKVDICHKGKKTISVSENAISAHLKHGDVIGTCDNDDQSSSDKKSIENQLKDLKKEFKAKEKELKEQLKDLKKDKKSQNHDD